MLLHENPLYKKQAAYKPGSVFTLLFCNRRVNDSYSSRQNITVLLIATYLWSEVETPHKLRKTQSPPNLVLLQTGFTLPKLLLALR